MTLRELYRKEEKLEAKERKILARIIKIKSKRCLLLKIKAQFF